MLGKDVKHPGHYWVRKDVNHSWTLLSVEVPERCHDDCSMGNWEFIEITPPTRNQENKQTKFKLGDFVTKSKGSCWTGIVVGTYSTKLTPEGYAVESMAERGSVQIYPAAALEPADRSYLVRDLELAYRVADAVWQRSAQDYNAEFGCNSDLPSGIDLVGIIATMPPMLDARVKEVDQFVKRLQEMINQFAGLPKKD